MDTLPIEALAKSIQQVFIGADKYVMDKYVPTFTVDGAFFGDCFSMVMVEPIEGEPPFFYHTFSPYDVVSGKAPDQALVFRDGQVLLNADFAKYIVQRTGIMSSLVLRGLGVKSLQDKRLLMIGTGKNARCALRALKTLYPDFSNCDFINAGSDPHEFKALAKELDLTYTRGDLANIGDYDYIICHSSAKQPVLTAAMVSRIKPGAIIASFVSEDHRELAPEFYNAKHANVLIDWEQTIHDAPELTQALQDKRIEPRDMIHLRELFAGKAMLNPDARYTVYRSHGTPMQNLAVLKLLLASR